MVYNQPMLLDHHPLRRHIAYNTLMQLIGRIISSGITFIILVSLAKFLGPAGYGDLGKVIAYVTMFFLMADFGVNAVFLQLQKSNQPPTFAELLGLRIILATCTMGLALAILALLPQGTTQGYTLGVRLGVMIYLPVILLHAVITSANAVFQRHLAYDRATLALSSGSIAAITFFFLLRPSIVTGLVVLILGTLITAGVSLYLVSRLGESLKPKFSWSMSKRLLVLSAPLGATLLVNTVYVRLDSVLLTLLQPTVDVGIYSLAYKVFELPLVIPVFTMNAVYPILLAQPNTRAMMRKVWQAGLGLGALSIIVTIVGIALAPLLSLVRADFNPSIPTLRILLLGLPFFYASSVTMWALVATNQRRALISIYSIAFIVNLGLNIAYIPRYSFLAAAWITGLSELLVLLLSLGILRRHVLKH